MAERAVPPTSAASPVMHGGNLHEAARLYGIPYRDWLDLSTGINPHGYPVPPVPADAWRRLPDDGDGFAACAARYYGAPDAAHVLPVAGSQAAIRALPALLGSRAGGSAVGIAALTYGEYAPAFEHAGHDVQPLDISLDTLPDHLTHAVVVNPNNPTAERVSAKRLLAWHAQLSSRGGTLIVDEAFADAFADGFADAFGDSSASHSVAASTDREGLVVLRSPGKFFGLAGVRAGFVLASPALLARLNAALGAWTVSGPARHAVRAAFDDIAWQHAMRARLNDEGARLAALLARYGLAPQSTPLFSWTADARAPQLHRALAERGIWTRLFAQTASVRLGLPSTEAEWARLETALADSLPTRAR